MELSGLPVFDHKRDFRGYRGFGVCRDLPRINRLLRARPVGFMAQRETPLESEALSASPLETTPAESGVPGPTVAESAPRTERPTPNGVPAAANVVPFRPGAPPQPTAPTLSPVERKAFRELAQELTARLRGVPEDWADKSSLTTAQAEDEAGAAESADAPPAAPVSESASLAVGEEAGPRHE
jgi:hypothetical protein